MILKLNPQKVETLWKQKMLKNHSKIIGKGFKEIFEKILEFIFIKFKKYIKLNWKNMKKIVTKNWEKNLLKTHANLKSAIRHHEPKRCNSFFTFKGF